MWKKGDRFFVDAPVEYDGYICGAETYGTVLYNQQKGQKRMKCRLDNLGGGWKDVVAIVEIEDMERI